MSNPEPEAMMPSTMDTARMFSIVAHELRSPAAVISGYARMLADGRVPEDERVQSLHRMERAAERVAATGQQAAELAQWLVPRAAIPDQSISVDTLVAHALAGVAQADRVSVEVDAGASGRRIRALDRVALSSAVGTVIGTVARETGDLDLRLVVRAIDTPEACDLVVGPAALVGDATDGRGPEGAAGLSLERDVSNLALVLAIVIIGAHDGQLWTVGGPRGTIGMRLLTGH